MLPLTLYIHFPWCVRKCPYCDFNSHAVGEVLPERAYIRALLDDLEQDCALVEEGRELTAIFLGGGTPNLFSPAAIEVLIDGINKRLHLPEGVEITLEANPGASNGAQLAGYLAAGVNRLSLGAQSFDDRLLQRLGRIHSRPEILDAFEQARAAGFENINLDLMFGLPGQSIEQALVDLDQALAFEPEHLSWYQLTIEPNTLFHHQPPVLPDDDRLWEMQQRGQEKLAAAGYAQYEVSAYARKGYRCRHNLNYWQFGDYLGIGAGAHGKVTNAKGVLRRGKQKRPDSYLETAGTGVVVIKDKWLQAEDLKLEFMLNAMRLMEGVPKSLFEDRTGLPIDELSREIVQAQERGLMEKNDEWLRPTLLGRNFLNDLLALFQ